MDSGKVVGSKAITKTKLSAIEGIASGEAGSFEVGVEGLATTNVRDKEEMRLVVKDAD